MPTGLPSVPGQGHAQRGAEQRGDALMQLEAFVRGDVADQDGLPLLEDLVEDGPAERELRRRADATLDRPDRQSAVGIGGDDHAAFRLGEELHQAAEGAAEHLVELASPAERPIDVEHGPERLGRASRTLGQVERAELADRLEDARADLLVDGEHLRLAAEDHLMIADLDTVAIAETHGPRAEDPAAVEVGGLVPAGVDQVVPTIRVQLDPGMEPGNMDVTEADVHDGVAADLDHPPLHRDRPAGSIVGDQLQPGTEHVRIGHRATPGEGRVDE